MLNTYRRRTSAESIQVISKSELHKKKLERRNFSFYIQFDKLYQFNVPLGRLWLGLALFKAVDAAVLFIPATLISFEVCLHCEHLTKCLSDSLILTELSAGAGRGHQPLCWCQAGGRGGGDGPDCLLVSPAKVEPARG